MRARKRFGQHFLEPAWVAKLVAAIEPQASDRVIEIGPGRGAVTAPLAARVERLVAVEIDRDLAAALEARRLPNVSVVAADVLALDLVEIADRLSDPSDSASRAGVRIVGNLPYYISSPILIRLLEASISGRLRDATLMLQKEVADRLVATRGTGDYGPLTLSARLRADVVRLLSLPPGAFRPAPAVHSAVVRLSFRPPPSDIDHPALLIDIVRAVFTKRRKMMGNAFAEFAAHRGADAGSLLRAADIDPSRRPETLDLTEYGKLASLLAR